MVLYAKKKSSNIIESKLMENKKKRKMGEKERERETKNRSGGWGSNGGGFER